MSKEGFKSSGNFTAEQRGDSRAHIAVWCRMVNQGAFRLRRLENKLEKGSMGVASDTASFSKLSSSAMYKQHAGHACICEWQQHKRCFSNHVDEGQQGQRGNTRNGGDISAVWWFVQNLHFGRGVILVKD